MKSCILAILVTVGLSTPSMAVDTTWVHDKVFEAAQRLWIEEVDLHSEVLLQSYGISSKAQALACVVDNPVQLIRGRFDRYDPGVRVETLFAPLSSYEFSVYSNGEMVNRILIREFEGEWKVMESELCFPDCFDAAGILYKRFPEEDVRVMKAAEVTYLIFKGDSFENVLELNNKGNGFIERNPDEWMAIQKRRLDSFKCDPRFRESYEQWQRDIDSTDSKHE